MMIQKSWIYWGILIWFEVVGVGLVGVEVMIGFFGEIVIEFEFGKIVMQCMGGYEVFCVV